MHVQYVRTYVCCMYVHNKQLLWLHCGMMCAISMLLYPSLPVTV